MDNMKHRRLQELDRSDFAITKGDPDIRGWDVKNATGQKIGEVEELILDARQQKIRYMVVELDDDDLDLEDDKKVLIPIGLAELDKDDDDVMLPSLTVAQLQALPAYDRDSLNDETERQICAALGRPATDHLLPPPSTETTGTGANDKASSGSTTANSAEQPAIGTADYYGNFYQHAFFSDYNLYKNRRMTESKPEAQEGDSDYERGLRLWELRSEGGVIPDSSESTSQTRTAYTDEQRKEMVRERRQSYEERRGNRKGSTIIQRIKDEGMQDAGR
jgi:hypothetical protein